jgi:nicotinamidase/pyrazinamidase
MYMLWRVHSHIFYMLWVQDHVSFFTTAHRAGAAAPANTVRLFPPHCVAGSPGAELAPGLTAAARVAHHVVRKGQRPEAESLSAFYDADRRSSGLSEWLRARNVADVAVAGVATELCVRATALDAAQDGFGVAALVDCVGAAQPAAGAAALGEVAARGGRLLRSAEWLAELPLPPSP